MQDAVEAIRILEDMQGEERARVVDLFGEGRSVSRYLKEMTQGRYDLASYDLETHEIRVRGEGGEWVGARQLSGGAFDQLYFATRLSIAEHPLVERRTLRQARQQSGADESRSHRGQAETDENCGDGVTVEKCDLEQVVEEVDYGRRRHRDADWEEQSEGRHEQRAQAETGK